jgi:CspA family cold shock protein
LRTARRQARGQILLSISFLKIYMAENQAKKEQKKKKTLAKQDKAARAQQRRQNSDKGKNLEEMFMYVDEYGNLTSSPPDMSRKKTIDAADIVFRSSPQPSASAEPEAPRKGRVTYYSDAKGFGFITDSATSERIFVHASELAQPVSEGDVVSFFSRRNEKGFFASNVSIIAS